MVQGLGLAETHSRVTSTFSVFGKTINITELDYEASLQQPETKKMLEIGWGENPTRITQFTGTKEDEVHGSAKGFHSFSPSSRFRMLMKSNQ